MCAIIASLTDAVLNGYMRQNPIMGVVLIIVIILITYIMIKFLKRTFFMLAIGLTLGTTLNSCNYAKANQKVLLSDDCGKTWVEVQAGEHVSKGGINPCFQKVVIPNYPMDGDMKFIANLNGTDKIRAEVEIDYSYRIVDGLKFMKEAKSLGKSNVDADDEAAIGLQFESAENRVIDKRLKDVAKRLLEESDIVGLDVSDMEMKIQQQAQEVLSKYGIEFDFITFILLPDDLTRQAIDASIAMKIYNTNGIGELGKQLLVARAGANSINIINKENKHQPQ